jgi:hypothetical protein
MIPIGSEFRNPNDLLNVQVTEIKSLDAADTCDISLTSTGEFNLIWRIHHTFLVIVCIAYSYFQNDL